MEISTDKRVEKFLKSLPEPERMRSLGYIGLFKENGFHMTGKYLKKLNSNLWELRPGNIRLLFGRVGKEFIIVNAFRKKTQKTPKQEIEIGNRRVKEHLV